MHGSQPGHIDDQIREYEGLVHSTAMLLLAAGGVEGWCLDDIKADLRIKVWRALLAYDPVRARQPVRKFVFMCVRNRVKDLGARRRHRDLSLDAMLDATDGSADRAGGYLAHVEAGYGNAEDPGVRLPSTLSALERQVLVLVYRDYSQREIAAALALAKRDVDEALDAIRGKLADWPRAA